MSTVVGVFGGFLGSRLHRLGVFTIGECLGMVRKHGSVCQCTYEMNLLLYPLHTSNTRHFRMSVEFSRLIPSAGSGFDYS